MPKPRTADQDIGGKDWEKLQADLKRLGPGIRAEFNRDMRRVVRKVAADAAKRAPKRSGALRKGIVASVTGEHATVVSKAPHARISEFGGRHPLWGRWITGKGNHPARPHMRPAAEAAKPEIDRAAQEAVKRAALAAGWR